MHGIKQGCPLNTCSKNYRVFTIRASELARFRKSRTWDENFSIYKRAAQLPG